MRCTVWRAVYTLSLALTTAPSIAFTAAEEPCSNPRSGPIRPLPAAPDANPGEVALGQRLFHEPRLSRDGTISCASCHDIERGGIDGRRVSRGIHGQEGTRNAPTVLNSGFNFRQFWDGRAATLEAQVDGPLLHPAEMGASWDHALAVIREDPSLTASF